MRMVADFRAKNGNKTDPFLPEAMTRQEADGQYLPLAQLFAQTLAQEVSAWLATDSLR